jgi:hypothetical protein
VPVQCLNAPQLRLCPVVGASFVSAVSRRFAGLCRNEPTKGATRHNSSSRVDKLGVTGSSPVPPIHKTLASPGVLCFVELGCRP